MCHLLTSRSRFTRLFLLAATLYLLSGCLSEPSNSNSNRGSTNPGNNTLSQPTQLIASSGPEQVVLNWRSVTGATAYWVYVSKEADIHPSLAHSYIERVRADSDQAHRVERLEEGVPYYFLVTAFANGKESKASTRVSAIPKKLIAFADFKALLADTPELGWVQLNQSSVENLFPPDDLSVSTRVISVFRAWPSMAYISSMDYIMAWGGGHANTAYNAPFHFDLSSLRWYRTFLPTRSGTLFPAEPHDPARAYLEGELVDQNGDPYRALNDLSAPSPNPYENSASWEKLSYQTRTADGWRHSPVSAHTYSTNVYLPTLDRFATWGGARIADGGAFRAHMDDGPAIRSEGEFIGPYLLDYHKHDAWKVAGLTGSHYSPDAYPDIEGAEAWTVLEGLGAPSSRSKTDVRVEDGNDVIYLAGASLQRVVIPEDTSQATADLVGNFNFNLQEGAGAISDSLNAFVSVSRFNAENTVRWTYWDISDPINSSETVLFVPHTDEGYPIDPELSSDYHGQYPARLGLRYDPVRERFVLADRQGGIWILHEPDSLQADGWFIETLDISTAHRPSEIGQFSDRGMLGMWQYAHKWDVFLHVSATGDVWAWKPNDWSPTEAMN